MLFSSAICESPDLEQTARTPGSRKHAEPPRHQFRSRDVRLAVCFFQGFVFTGQTASVHLQWGTTSVFCDSDYTMAHSSHGNASDGIKLVRNTIVQYQSQQVYITQWETWHGVQIFVQAGTARSWDRAWERTLTAEESLPNCWAINAVHYPITATVYPSLPPERKPNLKQVTYCACYTNRVLCQDVG